MEKRFGEEVVYTSSMEETRFSSFLGPDPRPAFSILRADIESESKTFAIFTNTAFTDWSEGLKFIECDDILNDDFKAAIVKAGNSTLVQFEGQTWTKFVYDGLYLVLSCSPAAKTIRPSLNGMTGRDSNDVQVKKQIKAENSNGPTSPSELHVSVAVPTKNSLDMFIPGFQCESQELTDHMRILHDADWSQSGLGNLQDWPEPYKQRLLVSQCEPRPNAMFMGPNKVMIYNRTFASLLDERHPSCLGKPLHETHFMNDPDFADFKSEIERVLTHRHMTEVSNARHESILIGGDARREVYYRYNLISLSGEYQGLWMLCIDVTREKLIERRGATLGLLAQECAVAKTMKDLWSAAASVFRSNVLDMPYAAIYIPHHEGTQTTNENHAVTLHRVWHRFDVVGTESAEKHSPEKIDIALQSSALVASISQALQTAGHYKFPINEQFHLDDESEHPFRCRQFNEEIHEVTVCPIQADEQQTVGFLLIGTNPRRVSDDASANWLSALSNIIRQRAIAIIAAEESRLSREQETEAQRQQRELNRDALHQSTKEANIITHRLQNFLTTLDLVDIGYYEYDLDGRLLHANAPWYRMTGSTRESVEQNDPNSFLAWTHPDDVPKTQDAWGKMVDGQPTTIEMRLIGNVGAAPDAEPRVCWVLAAATPQYDENHQVNAITGLVIDIDHQKKSVEHAEQRTKVLEQLRASEQRFMKFTDTAPVGVYIADASGKLKYVNNKWRQQCNVTDREDWSDFDWHEPIFEEDYPKVNKAFEDVIMNRKHVSVEYRVKRMWTSSDGRQHRAVIQAQAWPEIDDDGQLCGLVGTSIDVSSQKWNENFHIAQVEEAVEAKKQAINFIDMISHELRNPLSAIIQCTEALLAAHGDLVAVIGDVGPTEQAKLNSILEEGHEAIKTISSCAQHQKNIVGDVLTLGKLDAKLLIITPETVSPVALLKHTFKMFEVEAQRQGVELTYEVHESYKLSGLDWAYLDQHRVLQILINLTTNAIKFTKDEKNPEKKVKIIMGVKAKEQEASCPIDYIPAKLLPSESITSIGQGKAPFYLWFAVQDTGCGLNAQEKTKLFHRFQQGNVKTHSKYGGSGLGLYISRELTELLGGEIGLCSKPGEGSIFKFYITTFKAPVPENVKNSTAESDTAPVARSTTQDNETLDKPHSLSILVVEDNLTNQQVLAKQLRRAGHTVHVANHGQEAIDFLKTTRLWKGNPDGTDLDIMLLDVEMPVMNGLTCSRKIRDLQAQGEILHHLPIISVSANARPEQVQESIDAGSDDAITKPFRIIELTPKMARLTLK